MGPEEWVNKGKVLSDWCEKEGRDPKSILRSANIGFYMGADARGAARGEERYQREWGADTRGFTGFLRGTPSRAAEVVNELREAGVERLNIAVRSGPYDWDALAAFAEQIVPVTR